MKSYLWIFVLGSLIVTGVKMQDDGVEGAENADSPADDLAPEDSTIPDEAADAEEPAEEPAPEDPAEEAVDEAAAPAEPEDTNPETDAATKDQPATEDAEETAAAPSAEEEPAGEEAEAEITPEEAPDDAEEEPAQEEAEGGEADADADTEADSTTVPEEPVEPAVAVEDNSAGFDLSDALEKELQPEDPVKTELGDADQHSSGQGRARSAGAVSEPNDSGSGTVVGVVCGIAVAAVGAIIGYFTYQKKKLCFKVQRGDPESAKEENGTQSHEVLSTLLKSSEHASAAGNELA
ncbi:translation initiation factor IF-2-like isoform X6 [Sinocyclocheilus anshuiensis]|uniref:translation initiation factor IF-2-like isoform X6 n=1 Tax=Sinocyclocheilus anshuiensis TaxID=1608454 RepID=UPI0007B902C1|nr:PREDICTED: translation initiation factor IF-2-like isoform X6 [Sinocyclocheilus anshuiensis]